MKYQIFTIPFVILILYSKNRAIFIMNVLADMKRTFIAAL